ncbi:MAG: hypothetical protein CMG66_04145 [Candidatus Marinimicrobia bacterium]|nr:hypothetical protein [Candidatus Neomarinimicrobiota bacterium]|tara:strand:+ start:4099 stop:4569 length:471 start_codon:yes stop_codon:yes gene_type:complete
MDCDNYKDKILLYIDNELNQSEKQEFERHLEKDSELKKEYLEMKMTIKALSGLPKVEANNDFIISLNKKIDAYELYQDRKLSRFINNIFKIDYFPRFSLVAMSLVFIFSLFYFWDSNTMNSSSLILSNSSSIENDDSINNEVADLDSLEEYLDINK